MLVEAASFGGPVVLASGRGGIVLRVLGWKIGVCRKGGMIRQGFAKCALMNVWCRAVLVSGWLSKKANFCSSGT